MGREFDIYLRRRLTECDMIVYSIPFRDGLSIIDRIVLESCVESYTLQKFVAIQTESELVSHIDEMLKICSEKLQLCTSVKAEAEFVENNIVWPKDVNGIVLGADKIKFLSNVFERVNEKINIDVATIAMEEQKSLGKTQNTVEMQQSVKGMIRRSLERFDDGVEIGVTAEEMKTASIEATDSVCIKSELSDLLFHVSTAGESMAQIAASVLDAEVRYSLGGGESTQWVHTELLDGGVVTRNYEAAEDAVALVATAIIYGLMDVGSVRSGVSIGAEASGVIRKYRYLFEMDEDALSVYDDLDLGSVAYITIDE